MDFPALFRKYTQMGVNTADPSFKKALALFKDAARRVPAYKDFLNKHGVRPELVKTKADFAKLPRTDKPNYISKYSLSELSWDGTLENARYISTSSGSTGVPFFWPRGIAQDEATGGIFQNIYNDLFKPENGPFLFVNSFALGTWIAGFEFYNSTKWAGDAGVHVTIVTPGIDKSEVLRQIHKLSPQFRAIVIGGYPPFVKDIIESCATEFDLAAMDLRLMVAGEAVSVAWKQKILEKIGRAGNYDSFLNVYGMAEAGVVAHDTPLAQLLREHIEQLPPEVVHTSDGLPVTGLYQYYPELRYFEAEANEALALTADAGLPLIRYDTRDTGGIIARSMIDAMPASFRAEAEKYGVDLTSWKLPFVYLNGRKDLSISFYALMIYVENVKYALEASESVRDLSGLFTMSVEHTAELDQQFLIHIELAGGKHASENLADALSKEIAAKLRSVNSEYAKLSDTLGDKALPKVVLLPHGHIHTVPGRKHKWVVKR